ncbi:hypothetical protein HAX54_006284, partial [Datura stramonium]|nr:hypothetical protein [Datura stramonium]
MRSGKTIIERQISGMESNIEEHNLNLAEATKQRNALLDCIIKGCDAPASQGNETCNTQLEGSNESLNAPA